MRKYAILFAGQGAQKPGMGISLYDTSLAARAVFDEAGDDIKFDCFEADAERLRQTEVTQPAVYTVDIAAYAALYEELGTGDSFPEPAGVAGFSLGEYAAFTAAGVIGSLETGLELVRKRSLLMKAAGTDPDGNRRGAMAAGMGTKEAVLALVEKARGGGILEAVNFNSPQQTVVAGDMAAVERFEALAKEGRSSGVKAIPLSVSGAFHSPIMRPAAEGLAEALADYTFGEPVIPVYLNATGRPFDEFKVKSAEDNDSTGEMDSAAGTDAKVKAVMASQIQSPVQWQKTIESMAGDGIDFFIEVGPGKTLSGLVKKIAPGLTALHAEDAESLAEAVAALREAQR